MNTKENYLAQLDSVIGLYKYSGDYEEAALFSTAALSAIDRMAGHNSTYSAGIRAVLETSKGWPSEETNQVALGAIKALRHDLESGYLTSVRELIHGEVFGDFLEMAMHLLGEGYKDAAAVLAGGVLETHLRQLCAKHAIELDFESNGDVKQKTADSLNADLKKANVYSGLDQKSVTSWLDLRNKAAHARYDEYAKEQVAIFLSWLSDFITRNPA